MGELCQPFMHTGIIIHQKIRHSTVELPLDIHKLSIQAIKIAPVNQPAAHEPRPGAVKQRPCPHLERVEHAQPSRIEQLLGAKARQLMRRKLVGVRDIFTTELCPCAPHGNVKSNTHARTDNILVRSQHVLSPVG